MAFEMKVQDAGYMYIPLMGAVKDLGCTKLLLEYGANLYVKVKDDYPIWKSLLVKSPIDDNILVAKYIIVDRKMPVPRIILYTAPDHKPRDIFYFINHMDFSNYPEKQKAKDEILNYLKTTGFPKQGAYKE